VQKASEVAQDLHAYGVERVIVLPSAKSGGTVPESLSIPNRFLRFSYLLERILT